MIHASASSDTNDGSSSIRNGEVSSKNDGGEAGANNGGDSSANNAENGGNFCISNQGVSNTGNGESTGTNGSMIVKKRGRPPKNTQTKQDKEVEDLINHIQSNALNNHQLFAKNCTYSKGQK